MSKAQSALETKEARNIIRIAGKICRQYFFHFLVVLVITLMFLNVWLRHPRDFGEFLIVVNNSTDILLVAILSLLTAYYAFETGKLRKLQEEYIQMIKDKQLVVHFEHIKRKIVDAWIQELMKWSDLANNLLEERSDEIRIRAPNSLDVEKEVLFDAFLVHFPKEGILWNELKKKVEEYNTKYLNLVKKIESQLEKETGLRVPQKWKGQIGILSPRIVIVICTNLINKDLGENLSEWYGLKFEEYSFGGPGIYDLRDIHGTIARGSREKVERCIEILKSDDYFEIKEYVQVVRELIDEAQEISEGIAEFESELRRILELPKFPNTCEFCPP